MRWFPRFSVRTFQFRLMAYLLVIGSIPLVLSMFVFYSQSSYYAKQELSRYVMLAHEQINRQLEQEMASVTNIARIMQNDYIVQEYLVTRDTAGQQLTLDAIMNRVKDVRDEQMANSRYVDDICVKINAEQTNCSQLSSSALIDSESMYEPRNKSDTFFLFGPFPQVGIKAWPKDSLLMISPLYDRTTGAVKGEIAVFYNLGSLLQQITSQSYGYTLFNNEQIGFSSEKSVTISELLKAKNESLGRAVVLPTRIVSTLSVTVSSAKWTSRLDMPNEYAASSWQSLRNTLLLLFAILLAVSAISAVVFSRLITKPLGTLRNLMKRAEAGDWKAYWMSRSMQDINELGDGYNQMLLKLEELFRQVKREEALKKEAEIEALQYQLNPHFLYNTLNTIKWVAKIHKTPQISEVVSALVRLLQASLGKKGDFLTLREEVGLIRDYMEIQSFRFGEQVKLEIDVDPLASVCLVPRLILQPLVENALIHGIEPSERDGIIRIKAWLDRDLLLCQVEDNGNGMPLAEQESANRPMTKGIKEKMSGIGIRHIREKIKLYYGPDYKMHVFSKLNEGTTIRLSLPIHREED